MLHSLRHRRLHLLRLLMLALVGIGVFGTSLAAALTDIHMLAHTDIGADVHEHDDSKLAMAPDAEDSANALLHALVHCVDCHGHGGVLPFAAVTWDVAMPPAATATTPHDTRWRPAPLESLLRPPITA